MAGSASAGTSITSSTRWQITDVGLVLTDQPDQIGGVALHGR